MDFIFGSATAYFEQCEIHSKNRNKPVNSYNTAASTAEGQAYGYVFERCSFTGECPEQTAYLGQAVEKFRKDSDPSLLSGKTHLRRGMA